MRYQVRKGPKHGGNDTKTIPENKQEQEKESDESKEQVKEPVKETPKPAQNEVSDWVAVKEFKLSYHSGYI